MTKSVQFTRQLEKVRRLADAGRYERAFAAADRLRKRWPDNPQALVLWANLLQLQDADVGPPLEAAHEALARAVALDEKAPLPRIELGCYLYAIEDDAKAANKCLAEAVGLAREQLREALLAQAEALSELGRSQQALACLAEAYWLQAHNGKSANGVGGRKLLDHFETLKEGA